MKLQSRKYLTTDLKPQPWTQIARVLKDGGHDSDANEILIELQKLRWGRELTSPLKFPIWLFQFIFLRVLSGYGYKTSRALYFSTFIIVFGVLVFEAARDTNMMKPANVRLLLEKNIQAGVPNAMPKGYECVHPIFYSMDLFFPFADLSQDKYWIPKSRYDDRISYQSDECTEQNEKRRFWHPAITSVFAPLIEVGFAKYWYWFHIGAGWILSTIAIAGFTGVLKRSE